MQTSIQLSYGVIYKVTNNFNGKCYIGQTTDYKRRLRKYRLLHCKGQPKLYNALKKYGISNFTFDIITSTPTMKQLDILEKLYIALLDTIKTGYNCDRGGRGVKLFKPKNCIIKTHINKHGNKGRIPWNKGGLLSLETKEKMRLVKLGKKRSAETMSKIRMTLSKHSGVETGSNLISCNSH